ncbi:MAG: hypothetical protein J1F64_04720 [Oscillospiraceae bacterium]|nr:hypothetical protein [Oscillospiraceae bacterium]
MKKNLTNEIFLRIVTVVISVLVWFVIIYTKNPIIEINVKNIPVTFTYEDSLEERGLCVIRSEKPLTASVTLSGTRGDLFNAIDKVNASINLSGISEPGEYNMQADFSIPVNSVRISRKNTATYTVTADNIAEKDIPVIIEHNGLNKTYLVSSSAVPDTLRIRGAQSETDRIESARAYVDISTMTSSENAASDYFFSDGFGNEITGLYNVHTDFDSISVSNKLYRKKVMNIEVIYPTALSGKYDIRTKTVSPAESVAGVSENLYDEMKSIRLYAPDTLTPGQNRKFSIPLPSIDGVYFENQESILVIADIEEKRNIQKTVPIEYTGISKDKLSGAPQSITPEFFTTERRLEDAQITASVDLSGYTPGEYKNVPVSITVPDQITVIGIYGVDIEITV